MKKEPFVIFKDEKELHSNNFLINLIKEKNIKYDFLMVTSADNRKYDIFTYASLSDNRITIKDINYKNVSLISFYQSINQVVTDLTNEELLSILDMFFSSSEDVLSLAFKLLLQVPFNEKYKIFFYLCFEILYKNSAVKTFSPVKKDISLIYLDSSVSYSDLVSLKQMITLIGHFINKENVELIEYLYKNCENLYKTIQINPRVNVTLSFNKE